MKIKSIKSTIRYKIINHKRKPLCDYLGKCKNLAYKEVYPCMLKYKRNKGWSYLCKKHFIQERRKYKNLPYCSID
jgi:hypothetical protein